MNDLIARAKREANLLSDPTTKRHSFYFLLTKKVKKYGESRGLDLSLRKPTIALWVEEYLLEIYTQYLPIKEEKKLTSAIFLIDFIMEKKLPDFVLTIVNQKKQTEISGDFKRKIFKEVYGYKVPRKEPRY